MGVCHSCACTGAEGSLQEESVVMSQNQEEDKKQGQGGMRVSIPREDELCSRRTVNRISVCQYTLCFDRSASVAPNELSLALCLLSLLFGSNFPSAPYGGPRGAKGDSPVLLSPICPHLLLSDQPSMGIRDHLHIRTHIHPQPTIHTATRTLPRLNKKL